LAGCGVPADSQPHSISAPAPYRDPTPTIASPTAPPVASLAAGMEKLYLVRGDAVVAVTRQVDQQPNAQSVLSDLTAGPTPDEKARGLSSVLAGSTAIQGVSVDGGLATVALGDVGLDGASKTNVLAMAQIVCTLNALPDINQVVFMKAGVRASVPRGDGSQATDPVTSADYAQVVQPG
jgi:spore germination protein GerM